MVLYNSFIETFRKEVHSFMTTIDATFFSENLSRKVSYSAIIPGKSRKEKSLKTLYLLHGYSGDRKDWFYAGNIEQLAERYNIAVIMPSGENSYYVDHPNGMQYGKFIGEELVKETRSLFPLSRDFKETWIAGLSMGGYGALRNGLYYNETFGKVVALSSRILRKDFSNPKHTYPDRIMRVLIGSENVNDMPDAMDLYQLITENKTQPDLYMACGTSDFLYQDNLEFHYYLKAQEIEHHYVESEGDHNWTFWNQQIIPALEWLTL